MSDHSHTTTADSSVDMKARNSVWHGKIPLEINLAATEVSTLEAPPPLFTQIHRCSYLPLIVSEAKKHFSQSAPPVSAHDSNGVWFDFNGIALKWYIPVGVLFDIMHTSANAKDKSVAIPWKIVIHFQDYPTSTMLRCPDEDTARWHFINNMKEADYLLHGNSKRVMDLEKSDQILLWDSIRTMDQSSNWSVRGKVSGNVQKFHNYPIRLYTGDDQCWTQIPVTNADNIDLDIDNKNENGSSTSMTLFDALEILKSSKNDVAIAIEKLRNDEAHCIVHGVEIPAETPLSWLWLNMANPDAFVHIILF